MHCTSIHGRDSFTLTSYRKLHPRDCEISAKCPKMSVDEKDPSTAPMFERFGRGQSILADMLVSMVVVRLRGDPAG